MLKKNKFVYLVESPNLGFLDPNSTHYCAFCRSKYLELSVDFQYFNSKLLEEKVITQEDLIWLKLSLKYDALKDNPGVFNDLDNNFWVFYNKIEVLNELKSFIIENFQKFDLIKNEYLLQKGLAKFDENFSINFFPFTVGAFLRNCFNFDMLKSFNSKLLEKGLIQQEDLAWFCDEFLQFEKFLLINTTYQKLEENKKQYYRKVYDYLKKNGHSHIVFNANKWKKLNKMLEKQLKEGIITENDLRWLELSKIQDKDSVEYKELMENKTQYYEKIYKNLKENKEDYLSFLMSYKSDSASKVFASYIFDFETSIPDSDFYIFNLIYELLVWPKEHGSFSDFACDFVFEKLMKVVSTYPWDLDYDYNTYEYFCFFSPVNNKYFPSLKVRFGLFNEIIKEGGMNRLYFNQIKDLEDQNLDFLLDSLKFANFKAWENTRVELNEIFFEFVAGKLITKVRNIQILFDPNSQEDFSFYQPMKNSQNCLAFYFHRGDKNNVIEQNRNNCFYFEFHWKTTENNIFHELFEFGSIKDLGGLDYLAEVRKKILLENDFEKREKILEYFFAIQNIFPWERIQNVYSTLISYEKVSRVHVEFLLTVVSLCVGMPIELRNSLGEPLEWWEECLKEITNLKGKVTEINTIKEYYYFAQELNFKYDDEKEIKLEILLEKLQKLQKKLELSGHIINFHVVKKYDES